MLGGPGRVLLRNIFELACTNCTCRQFKQGKHSDRLVSSIRYIEQCFEDFLCYITVRVRHDIVTSLLATVIHYSLDVSNDHALESTSNDLIFYIS